MNSFKDQLFHQKVAAFVLTIIIISFVLRFSVLKIALLSQMLFYYGFSMKIEQKRDLEKMILQKRKNCEN
jgi:hypothetical protein